MVSKNKEVCYKLFTRGEEITHPLTLRKSHNLTVQKNENEFFYISLEENKSGKPRMLKINVVSLVGKVKIYFSNF